MKSIKAEDGSLFFPTLCQSSLHLVLLSETPGFLPCSLPQGPAPLPLTPPLTFTAKVFLLGKGEAWSHNVPLNPPWSSSIAHPLEGGPCTEWPGNTPEVVVPQTPSYLHTIDYLIFACFHFLCVISFIEFQMTTDIK